jgi:phosphoribosylamine--glycine ligase
MVVKADGLAAGKGVVVATTVEEAMEAVRGMLGEGRFGDAGRKLVIEDFLTGEEASVLALTDGTDVLVLPPAQDHKRIGDGDTGPNTGGMGAYAPAPVITPKILDAIRERVLIPAIREMAALGSPFSGVLYAGLMITSEGPKVVEFNARFGDPETQVILPLIKDDLVPALVGAAKGDLAGVNLGFLDAAVAGVVVAASGYPREYRTGEEIRGIDRAERVTDVIVFHAGTRSDGGKVMSAGGRVLNVVALGRDIRGAVDRAYQGVDEIDFPGGYCRRDIAHRVLKSRR